MLTYHGVREDEPPAPTVNLQGKHIARSLLADQLDWLRESGYRFLDGEELRFALRTGRLPKGPAALVTFDDGYANNRTLALPVLEERGIPAIVFVVGEFVEERRPLWVDELEQGFTQATADAVEVEVNGERRRFDLDGLPARRAAEATVRRAWRQLPAEKRRPALGDLLARLGVPEPAQPDLYRPLTWSDVAALRAAGWEIGSHTMTHTVLSALDDDAARREVGSAQELVDAHVDSRCDLFAYPNGLRGDFTDASRRVLAELGNACAFASIEGRVGRRRDPFALRRVSVRDGTSVARLRLSASGVIGHAKGVKAALAGVRRAAA